MCFVIFRCQLKTFWGEHQHETTCFAGTFLSLCPIMDYRYYWKRPEQPSGCASWPASKPERSNLYPNRQGQPTPHSAKQEIPDRFGSDNRKSCSDNPPAAMLHPLPHDNGQSQSRFFLALLPQRALKAPPRLMNSILFQQTNPFHTVQNSRVGIILDSKKHVN